jgi:nucleoid-associated protein YgaU
MIPLTKPIIVAAIAGVVAIGAIAVAAFRLTSTTTPPPPAVERPATSMAPAAGQGAAAPANPSAPVGPSATGAPAAPAANASASSTSSPTQAASAPAPASAAKPSFDVVRIDPSGDAVIAGRSEPRAQVSLTLSGKPVAQAQADADGQFVMLPPKLPPGEHVLGLRATGANGEVVSEQSVAIAVPDRGARETVAALAAPNKPTVVLSQPAAPPSGASGPELHIASVEALQGGAMFASGTAPAGANLRLYLNESYIASVEAGPDGKWSVRVERGMSSGAYRVRADRIGPDGRAVGRVEAPFDYPAELVREIAAASPAAATATAGEGAGASSSGKPAGAAASMSAQSGAASSPSNAANGAPAAAPAASMPVSSATATATATPLPASAQNAVVSELRTARVERGDSLWRISTSIYGEGIRYTQLYDANASQIRDPDLIYPGQVLVVPKQEEMKPPARERRR